ncbi:MAG: hypothetical protein ABIS03_07465 [Gemmatimonadaceae bacterium]
MTNMKRAGSMTLLALAATMAVTACAKKDDAAMADTTAMMTPPAMTNTVLRVDGMETGKGLNADKSVMDDAHDFGVRDTVYVSVKTEGTGTGTLAAKFTYQDGKAVQDMSQNITTTGEAMHEFHIQKATAWPKGDYKVEVMLDGVSAGTKDFTVK